MENRQVQVNLRLAASLKDAAEKVARDDHRSLTSLIEKLLREHVDGRLDLAGWHDHAIARFFSLLTEADAGGEIRHGLIVRSYSSASNMHQPLRPSSLVSTLQKINSEVSSAIKVNQFVYPYKRDGMLPRFVQDRRLLGGRNEEILESVALGEVVQPSLWRVSASGYVSDVRPYMEDRDGATKGRLVPGSWFSPLFMTQQLAFMALHAGLFSDKFEIAGDIEFRCEWSGLRERVLADPDPQTNFFPYDKQQIAYADSRVSTVTWPASDVRRSWPDIVSAMGGPVLRMFDDRIDYSPDDVGSIIIAPTK